MRERVGRGDRRSGQIRRRLLGRKQGGGRGGVTLDGGEGGEEGEGEGHGIAGMRKRGGAQGSREGWGSGSIEERGRGGSRVGGESEEMRQGKEEGGVGRKERRGRGRSRGRPRREDGREDRRQSSGRGERGRGGESVSARGREYRGGGGPEMRAGVEIDRRSVGSESAPKEFIAVRGRESSGSVATSKPGGGRPAFQVGGSERGSVMGDRSECAGQSGARGRNVGGVRDDSRIG